jgi:hypothetical protein
MTNDYLRCSKDVEYCRDWYLEKNKGTWNQTIVKESTPSWVVKDMVDLLPEDSFTLDAKFIDIFSKSGIFLEVIRNKLMRNQAHIDKFPDPKERFNYITRNQLYALVWCDGVEDVVENQLALTTVAIYGRLVDNPNVYRVEIDRKTLKKEEGVHKFIELFYSEEYFKGMKFDVVVGNPPYNSDKYLDFVTIGHGLASKYSLWITPAKWQAKGGKENDTFREKIVPYMSKIVYYPDTDDVFEIRMSGGISYYIIDKNVHKIKNTKVISNRCDSFRSDWEEQEIISIHRSAINNIIRKCNGTRVRIEQIKGQKYVGDRDSKIPYKSNGKISVMQGEEECGHVNKTDIRETGINDIDKYKCVMHSMLISPVTNSDGTHWNTETFIT